VKLVPVKTSISIYNNKKKRDLLIVKLVLLIRFDGRTNYIQVSRIFFIFILYTSKS
jgi:hypothetical protein